jgi:16S rRNA (guanine527-N7)-methyltransferase
MSKSAFTAAVDVSRETLARLETYETLLRKWNPAINLVAKSTLDDLWSRHFLDSAQIFSLAKARSGIWADLGTGGGFPGLVLAIMAAEEAPELEFHCVESDQRKATFLRAVVRDCGIRAQIHAERIESLEPLQADVLTARALAPLNLLLGFAEHHLKPGGQAIFPKGATEYQERSIALANWAFDVQEYPSKTDSNAVILSIGDIRRV